jgi:hypothetical protein
VVKVLDTESSGHIKRTNIIVVQLAGNGHLSEVAQALSLLSAQFRAGQRRQQQGCENRDDRNHDQQFDQRETSAERRFGGHMPVGFQ